MSRGEPPSPPLGALSSPSLTREESVIECTSLASHPVTQRQLSPVEPPVLKGSCRKDMLRAE